MNAQQPSGYRENIPSGPPPPGWYLDPVGRQDLRWWDGAQWGQETRPLPRADQQPQPPYPAQRPHPGGPSFTADPRYGTAAAQWAGQGQSTDDQQPHASQGSRQRSREKTPRKRRRVFLWVFLGVQALFLIWIIAGIASKPGGTPIAQQVAQQCGNGGWQGLFKSYADCSKHYAVALNDATDTGKGIGVALIVVFWVVVDIILGISYGVYKLAKRGA